MDVTEAVSGPPSTAGTTASHTSTGPSSSLVIGSAPCKVFIGQIPPSCSTATLTKIFSVFGNVLELILLREKTTQHHKGSAFCVYESSESAHKAVAELHDRYRLEGARRNLVVAIARSPDRPSATALPTPLLPAYPTASAAAHSRTKNIFVGTLSTLTTEQNLRLEFGRFGPVLEATILRDAQGMHNGCGFVKMFADHADTAIAAMHNTIPPALSTRPITVCESLNQGHTRANGGLAAGGGGSGGGTAGHSYPSHSTVPGGRVLATGAQHHHHHNQQQQQQHAYAANGLGAYGVGGLDGSLAAGMGLGGVGAGSASVGDLAAAGQLTGMAGLGQRGGAQQSLQQQYQQQQQQQEQQQQQQQQMQQQQQQQQQQAQAQAQALGLLGGAPGAYGGAGVGGAAAAGGVDPSLQQLEQRMDGMHLGQASHAHGQAQYDLAAGGFGGTAGAGYGGARPSPRNRGGYGGTPNGSGSRRNGRQQQQQQAGGAGGAQGYGGLGYGGLVGAQGAGAFPLGGYLPASYGASAFGLGAGAYGPAAFAPLPTPAPLPGPAGVRTPRGQQQGQDGYAVDGAGASGPFAWPGQTGAADLAPLGGLPLGAVTAGYILTPHGAAAYPSYAGPEGLAFGGVHAYAGGALLATPTGQILASPKHQAAAAAAAGAATGAFGQGYTFGYAGQQHQQQQHQQQQPRGSSSRASGSGPAAAPVAGGSADSEQPSGAPALGEKVGSRPPRLAVGDVDDSALIAVESAAGNSADAAGEKQALADGSDGGASGDGAAAQGSGSSAAAAGGGGAGQQGSNAPRGRPQRLTPRSAVMAAVGASGAAGSASATLFGGGQFGPAAWGGSQTAQVGGHWPSGGASAATAVTAGTGAQTQGQAARGVPRRPF